MSELVRIICPAFIGYLAAIMTTHVRSWRSREAQDSIVLPLLKSVAS
jgi:hypothetical protein